MNKIEELIAELCPDGVEFKALGEIASYPTDRIHVSEIDENSYVGVSNLLPQKRGKIASSYVPSQGVSIGYEKDDILIGNIRPYLKKIWLADSSGGTNQDVVVIRIDSGATTKIAPKFLYYILSSDIFFSYSMSHAKGAKMPRGNKKAILNFRIPIPPLRVQHEIVNILDTFSALVAALVAELEAELEARKKQYQYYRDRLLSFNTGIPTGISRIDQMLFEYCPEGVEFKALKDMALVSRGKRLTKRQLDPSGRFPVYSGGVTPMGYYGENNQSANTVTVVKYGTAGFVNYITSDFWANDVCYCIKPFERIQGKYLYYALKSRQDIIYSLAIDAIPAHLPTEVIKNFRIPVPPLEIQNETVSILDKFDALVNDLSIGLPAEIKARRKQYEYYRDRLLSFPESGGKSIK